MSGQFRTLCVLNLRWAISCTWECVSATNFCTAAETCIRSCHQLLFHFIKTSKKWNTLLNILGILFCEIETKIPLRLPSPKACKGSCNYVFMEKRHRCLLFYFESTIRRHSISIIFPGTKMNIPRAQNWLSNLSQIVLKYFWWWWWWWWWGVSKSCKYKFTCEFTDNKICKFEISVNLHHQIPVICEVSDIINITNFITTQNPITKRK